MPARERKVNDIEEEVQECSHISGNSQFCLDSYKGMTWHCASSCLKVL